MFLVLRIFGNINTFTWETQVQILIKDRTLLTILDYRIPTIYQHYLVNLP